jgi:hypothetical protein
MCADPAIWPGTVRRLALIAPFGLFDADDPPTDPWAQRADAIAHLAGSSVGASFAAEMAAAASSRRTASTQSS